jgi:hypothetical protein
MKTSTLLIAIVVGFLTSSLSAQETIWFDSNWNETTKESAFYYRPSPAMMNKGFWIVDYFMSGAKQMEGFSSTKEPNKELFNGLITYYFETGKTFQKVNYKKGKLHGDRKIFYETGELESERTYEKGLSKGVFSEYYKSGELKQTGKYDSGKQDGVWKTFYKNGKIKEKGKYRDGEKVGVWKTFYKNVY